MEQNNNIKELELSQGRGANSLLPKLNESAKREVPVSYDTKTKIVGSYDATTLKLFGALSDAYNYFQTHLFNNMLSHVVLTLNRRTKSAGYYMESAWVDDGEIKPEININPEMLHHEAIFVMSILVHEMCHHTHAMYGKPGRGKYHNKQFSKIMEAVGLICSTTGRPGGKKTGDRMSHYVVEGGRFEQVFNAMPDEYLIPFTSATPEKSAKKIADEKKKIKSKYYCPTCTTTFWGKANQLALCGHCNKVLIEGT